MTKVDIISSVYEKVGFSKKEAVRVVETIFDIMKESLERGEKIKISGLGVETHKRAMISRFLRGEF
jgi:integration host factor subunit alpha